MALKRVAQTLAGAAALAAVATGMGGHTIERVSKDDLAAAERGDLRELAQRYEIKEEFSLQTYYQPPGPVAQAFIGDWSGLTYGIMGPVGSGKTTACVFKRIMAATLAPVARHPDDNEPTRMCRWLVLRDSFRSAEKSVLESWKQWFPKTYPGSKWAGGNDRPVTHTLRFISNGVRVEIITEFAGLNDFDIETLMKGREYSGVWLNEFDTHADGALSDAETRVGRYPRDDILLTVAEIEALEKKLGRVVPHGRRLSSVICDFNAPSIDNHAYRIFVEKLATTPGRRFYKQPGGRTDAAENRFKLEKDYYEKIAANNEDHVVRRLVDNEFGWSRAGKPVFETFDYTRHVAKAEIGFDPNLDLIIGVDLSTNTLNPAAVFMQVKASGRIAIIDELSLGHGVGATRFAEMLKLRLAERYAGARNVRLYVDPAAQYGGDKEGGQLAAMETLSIIVGLPVLLPNNGSNELGARIDAVKHELLGYQEPHSHLLICPKRCPIMVKAMNGGYRFKKKTSGDAQYEEIPEKNHPDSDVIDAAQYGIQGVRGPSWQRKTGADRRMGDARRDERPARARPRGAFNPHNVGRA